MAIWHTTWRCPDKRCGFKFNDEWGSMRFRYNKGKGGPEPKDHVARGAWTRGVTSAVRKLPQANLSEEQVEACASISAVTTLERAAFAVAAAALSFALLWLRSAPWAKKKSPPLRRVAVGKEGGGPRAVIALSGL